MSTPKQHGGKAASADFSREWLLTRAARYVKRRREWLLFGPLMLLSWIFGSWIGHLARRYFPQRRWLSAALYAVALAAYVLAIGFSMELLTDVDRFLWWMVVLAGGFVHSLVHRRFEITFQNDAGQPLFVSFATEGHLSRAWELPPGVEREITVVSGEDVVTMVFEDRASSVSFERDIPFRWFRPQCRTVRIVPSDLAADDAVRPRE